MPDHIHWLVELRAGTLETVMKRFKSRTARQANRLLGRVGRFWQACYHDHAIRSDESLHRHAMYLMGNPIRAGLTTRLGQYPHAWCEWSLGRHVICPMTLAPVDSANQGWHLPKQCAHEPGGECVNQG
ncbi:TPA: transposase [Stenotrophomonas maltophilia]